MNHLAGETSPYLAQHADNPVDWHPWGEPALALARTEGRPILLSIGYSACHWCHVMAHESFEHEATAKVMNERFVNIKVDREERPDLDRAYQLAHHLLTRQSGGWPLTAFLDPETLLPFFTGTYFPRTPRHGLPGFVDVLIRISDAWGERTEDIREQGDKLRDIVQQLDDAKAESKLADAALLRAGREQLGKLYDPDGGGFGNAPKFPMPGAVERLLRHWQRGRASGGQPDREALDMVMTTLTKMARGGIFDHLGGGFCRYSTDREWMIPHFEKMLCDNGSLLALYADAMAVAPDALFEGALGDTAGWMMREMQHPSGGYYAALDADSDGGEGRHYVWRRHEVKRLLTEDEYLVVETLYGLDRPANFEGKWHLHRRDSWRSVAERLYLDAEAAALLLASARAKLFDHRSERPRPARDEKVLAAWNGLAIHGMVQAALRLSEPAWIDSAATAAAFVRERMVQDERLMASWTGGTARHPAYLDDYANMLRGVLALLEARWDDADFAFARLLADGLLTLFLDEEAGGFWFTAHDHEELIHRPKPVLDDALPPGNAIAVRALVAFGHLTAESRYLDAAHATLDWARGFAERQPAAHSALLTATEEATEPGETVILRGPSNLIQPWLEAARDGYQPTRRVYAIPYDSQAPSYLPRLVTAEARARVTAFVCRDLVCSPPIGELDDFPSALT
ncbi:MAG: thioredoxin domain-containing protein [Gammaproteobacteria bacterium]|nr:thioredoxin domain-containing protein [Gammaproteobacteria bacterium]